MLMTEKFVKLFFTVTVLSGIVYLSDTGAAEWVHVSGKVTSDDGTPSVRWCWQTGSICLAAVNIRVCMI